MQRQTPSCVDIYETMPVDSSTAGLFLGGVWSCMIRCKDKPLQPSCVDNIDIDETMPVDSSTAGLF